MVAVPGGVCATDAAVDVCLAAVRPHLVWCEDWKTRSYTSGCARNLPLEPDNGGLRLDWRQCAHLFRCENINRIAFLCFTGILPFCGDTRLQGRYVCICQYSN